MAEAAAQTQTTNESRWQRVRGFLTTEHGIASVFFGGLIVGLIVMGFRWGFDWAGIRVEAMGFLFDIALFGMFIAWFRAWWESQ